MKQREFIILSACSMMLTALGIDIMLPALAEVRVAFGLSDHSNETARIITFFFMGQLAQIIFGPLSDRYGRIPVLRIGFPLYIGGGIAATFAPTLPLVFTARFIAGMGASAIFMTVLASVRDRFAGNQMARVMSLIFTIFLFTPVIAPFLGLGILHAAGWKAVFLSTPVFGLFVFLWSLRLEESLPPEKRKSLRWPVLSHSLREVFRNRTFLRYTGVTTLLFSGLSTFVASSEHIVREIYGKPGLFVWIFGGMGLLMSACAFLNSRLSVRFGAFRVTRWLLIGYCAVSTCLTLLLLFTGNPPPLPLFVAGIALICAINLTIEPNSSSLALEPMEENTGLASSVYGTAYFFIGANMGSLISGWMTSSVQPLILSFLVFGCGALILALTDQRN